jgi:hypothetical protein
MATSEPANFVLAWPFFDKAGKQANAQDCDLCCEHYVWDCPVCGDLHGHWQVYHFPLDVPCQCGATMRLTEATAEQWRQAMGLRS